MIFKKTLAELHADNNGKVSDKWEIFVSIYERIFKELRNSKVKILEIGVQNGGSLEVWSKYFKHANLILGCDIDPMCGILKYRDQRITVLVGDATAEQTRQRILAHSNEFDIIIDDGSHQSRDVLNAFLLYFPMLNPGGIFVVEDTHTLYWDEFGGGLRRKDSVKEFFKDLTDVINYEHWRDDVRINDFISSSFDLQSTAFIADGWVESIEFYNSMIVIKKSLQPTHGKVGRRLITGTDALVNAAPLHLKAALMRHE